ncbi:hypothetical protein ACFS32_22915 [Novosphingobium pokkalii]|uniref:hypothetical protein n=1 Tax=Novosphingobium pokkalii TaxID=1770194 RepID=UPI003627D1B3
MVTPLAARPWAETAEIASGTSITDCARRCAVTTISPTAGADVGAAAGSWAAGASSARAGFATIVAVASAARLANP